MDMQTILIVEPFDIIRRELELELQKNYRVFSCARGDEGLQLLREHHPDGLIINLRLQGIDGLCFLEHMEDARPSVILTIAASYSPYLEQRLLDLAVDYPIRSGCPVRAIARHMRSFLEAHELPVPPSAQETVSAHLRILGVPHQGGFDDLRVGVPLYAQDPTQGMIKEFYPAVATLRGRDNWKQVEKAIWRVKMQAYENRNDAVWCEYFSDTSTCPKNREFIARLAEFV